MDTKVICPFCQSSVHVAKIDDLHVVAQLFVAKLLYRYYCRICNFSFNDNPMLEGKITRAMIALGYGMFGFEMAVNGKSIMICDDSHSFPEQGDTIRVILDDYIMRTDQGNFQKIKSWELVE